MIEFVTCLCNVRNALYVLYIEYSLTALAHLHTSFIVTFAYDVPSGQNIRPHTQTLKGYTRTVCKNNAQHTIYVSCFCTCIQSAVEKSFRKSFNERGEELMARNSSDGSESVVSSTVCTYVYTTANETLELYV